MTLNDRVAGIGVPAMPDVDIRTADANAAGAQEDLVILDGGAGDI